MTIPSAYNFVPLDPRVVRPEWADKVSHDLPLKGGVCAELDVQWTNHTPLLVGGERMEGDRTGGGVQRVRPFCHPDGVPALPGSALRGLVRNVLEIATFSRMRLVDDRAFSIRDFTPKFKGYTAKLVGGQPYDPNVGARPKAKAGWLYFDGNHWSIRQVDFYRVEQTLLMSAFSLAAADWRPKASNWTPSAREKYAILSASSKLAGGMSVTFAADAPKAHDHSKGERKLFLHYAKVTKVDSAGSTVAGLKKGVLVVCGQPNPNKHMEFVFGDIAGSGSPLRVSPRAYANFLEVHSDDNGDWKKYWKPKADSGVAVPVFFLTNASGAIDLLGLAQMMRLPGQSSVGEMIRSQYGNALEQEPDFVTTLFGRVSENAAKSVKGRVAFGDARLATPPVYANEVVTVMGQPKPQFYPNYLKQDAMTGATNAENYKTALSDNAQIRGWKRYPVGPATLSRLSRVPAGATTDVQVALRPLAANQCFNQRIRLHNVHPIELGAVLYALTWGGRPTLGHALGMGKAFGYGQMSATVQLTSLRANQPHPPAASNSADLITQFVQWMEEKIPGWAESEPMIELLAMANPAKGQANADQGKLTPPRLVVGTGAVNEFANAKAAGQVLLPYSML